MEHPHHEISLDTLTGGTLPAISAVSGVPADATLRSTFSVRASWWTPSFVAILVVLALNPTAAWALNKWGATWVFWPIYGVEILVLVALAIFKKRSYSPASISLDLPVSSAERRSRTTAKLLAACATACLIAAGVVAVSIGHSLETLVDVLFAFTVVACAIALVLVVGTPSIRGELRYDAGGKGVVVLKNAHPDFVRALAPRQPSADPESTLTET